MTASPYASIGARLVERGYAALPIIPQTKRPGSLVKGVWTGMHKWRETYTTRLPSRFELQIWSTAPDSGVCVVAGPASRNLVGVDIDTDQADIRIAILSVLPPTTLVKVGQKGETRFFRGSEILPVVEGGTLSPSWNIGKQRVCDFIGPGRQTVLPPSVHPDTGRPYRWTGPDALEDTDPDDLPELPADIFDLISAALVPFGYVAEPEYVQPASGASTGESEFRRLNDAAYGNLSAWIPALQLDRCRAIQGGYEAVAGWRASNAGRPIAVRKLNLKITAKGAVDFGDGPKSYTAINLVMSALACDFDTAYKFLSDRLDKPSTLQISLSARPAAVEHTGEVIPFPATTIAEPPESHASEGADDDTDPMEALTYCDGVLGQVVDWIAATALRPNRVLALGGALTVLGTLMGRRACGPTGSATHLYVVGLAPTGAGKQHPINCVKRLMTAAGAKHHLGPSQFISMPAVINFLKRTPLSLCPQDEFGSFLKRTNGRRASGFEITISQMFRTAWGTCFEPMETPEWAGLPHETISCPAMSVFGLSTPGEFYEALQGADVENGYLNRFLVMETDRRAPEQDPSGAPRDVPDKIAAALKEIFYWGGSSLEASNLNNINLDPTPQPVEWATPKAHDAYKDFSKFVDDRQSAEPDLEPFLGRACEIAIRLATIMAAGRWGPTAKIDAKDFEWAREVSWTCAERVGRAALRTMIIEMNHGQVYNKIMDLIKKRGGRAPHREIARALGKSVKSEKDLNSTIQMMAAGGAIKIETGARPAAGGTPAVWYLMG